MFCFINTVNIFRLGTCDGSRNVLSFFAKETVGSIFQEWNDHDTWLKRSKTRVIHNFNFQDRLKCLFRYLVHLLI